jgi:hypothetical protein
LLRVYGARELAAGIGLLAMKNQKPWLQARLGGDLLDIATLLWQRGNAPRSRRNAALAAVAAVGCVDAACAIAAGKSENPVANRFEHSNRSGFPQSPEAMRGSAVDNAEYGMSSNDNAAQLSGSAAQESPTLAK